MLQEWFTSTPAPMIGVVLSSAGMYVTILVLARWSGVRSFAQMSAFDVAVTIAIGSLLATSVVSNNPPLLHGITAAATLYGLQLVVSRLRRRNETTRRILDNEPILLMGPGGQLLHENMQVARVTEDDLRCQLRKANVIDPTEVQAVIMEGTGTVHVLRGHGHPPDANAWILRNVRDYSGYLNRL